MDMKLGGWDQLLMSKILKTTSRSSGSSKVKWGKHWCMDMKLGGWGQLLMLKILKVISRSSGVIQGQMGLTLVYGHETWWMGSVLDAENFEDHFKVIQGLSNLVSGVNC